MAGGCDLTLTPKRSRRRSSATRKCISPCPHSTMSWVRGFWIIDSEESSSFSRNKAWPSLTSSLRSVAEIAIASTGGNGSTCTSAGGAVLPLDSVSPVLKASSLPSATASPASAEGRLVSWAQVTADIPDNRAVSPDEDCSVAPSSRRPASRRASDSLPPCCKCTVLNT